MKLTTLFRLRKPDGTDPVNIEDFNDNFDVIDEELGKRLESTGAASDMTVAFEQASARTNLKTGEKISVSFGKIMKWFADLKTVAFSGSYNDLTSKPTIPSGAAASQAVANNCTTTAAGSVLDARQGKVLMDKANQLSSELDNVGATYDPIVGTMSVGNNELTNICNTWLVKGIYFINTHIRATLPTECNFEQYILVDDAQDPRGSSSKVLGAGFNDSNMGFILEIKATSSNVVLQARQYSGERVSIDGWIFVTRIK